MSISASLYAVPSSDATPLTSLVGGLDPGFNYTWAGVACLAAFIIYVATRPKISYDAIPAIGRTGFFTSYLDAIRYLRCGDEFIKEGYTKYQPGAFRVPELNRWQVVVSGSQLTDELRKAPDDVLSLNKAVRDSIASDWTLGPTLATNPYHLPVVRDQLTRNLGNLFSGLYQEIVLAFDDNIPLTEEWTAVSTFDTMMNIVSHASNYIFVGAPLCRDPEFIALNCKFTIDVVLGGQIIKLFPDFLKPLAGRTFTYVPKSIRTGVKHLAPIIEERKQKIAEYGRDYPDKPVDMLSWLMDEATSEELSAPSLTRRILALNVAAIHTTTMSFTFALYDLVSRPEYIEPIRQEIEAVIAEDGWSKVAMTRMRKLDSFLKESQRFGGLDRLVMRRLALKDFTFSDGTHIPKGTYVGATSAHHFDNNVYPDAGTFKGFRFSDIRDEDGEGTKHQMVATSLDYMPFGHGRHSCPGRFFAANELKAMMAHLLLTYDIMTMDTPKVSWFATTRMPDAKAKVMFRKRRINVGRVAGSC